MNDRFRVFARCPLLPSIATKPLRHGKRRQGQTCRLMRDILPFIVAGVIQLGRV
jgi:hypothetical protein